MYTANEQKAVPIFGRPKKKKKSKKVKGRGGEKEREKLITKPFC